MRKKEIRKNKTGKNVFNFHIDIFDNLIIHKGKEYQENLCENIEMFFSAACLRDFCINTDNPDCWWLSNGIYFWEFNPDFLENSKKSIKLPRNEFQEGEYEEYFP